MHGHLNSLHLFTDGSVSSENHGGYGMHGILSRDYASSLTLVHQQGSEICSIYQRCIDSLHDWSMDKHHWLSDRCSIDFCEAFAIKDGLTSLTTEMRIKDVKNIQEIQVISDSQTVLRWIDGTYAVRNPVMKNIIDDMVWQMGCIQDEQGVSTVFQWVHSHVVTCGNEHPDYLANQGM